MSVFASRETTYLENTAIFCNSVKSVRILMMLSITHGKTEISTKNTWALYLFHTAFHEQTYFLGGLSSEKCYLGYFKICVDQANVNSNLLNRSNDKSCTLR